MGKRTIAAAALVAGVVTCLLASASAADLAGWRGYVRRVVDAFGPNSRVVAMTITNEVNLTISPNASDGAYPHAARPPRTPRPIWITENGVASDRIGDAGQASALGQLVRAAHAYSATFTITD